MGVLYQLFLKYTGKGFAIADSWLLHFIAMEVPGKKDRIPTLMLPYGIITVKQKNVLSTLHINVTSKYQPFSSDALEI